MLRPRTDFCNSNRSMGDLEYDELQNKIRSCLRIFKATSYWRKPEDFLGDPFNSPFLHLACKYTDDAGYLQWMISTYHELNINQENPSEGFATGLHIAASCSNFRALALLVKQQRLDVNAITKDGNNALHCLMESPRRLFTDQQKCLELLLERDDLNVNHINRNGKTPLMLAVENNLREMVNILVLSGKVDLLAEVESREIREIIYEKFGLENSESEESMQKKHEDIQRENFAMELFKLLYESREDEFLEAIEDELPNRSNIRLLHSTDGWQTYLQVACEKNLQSVYRFLLQNGDIPTECTSRCPHPPLHLLTKHGDINSLIFLSYKCDVLSKGEDTILHYIAGHNEETVQMTNLLEKILNDGCRNRWGNINHMNNEGETALFVALQKKKFKFAHCLLECGAFLGSQNGDSSKNPLDMFPPVMLKDYLDSLISENTDVTSDIRLNYSNLLLSGTASNSMTVPRQIVMNEEIQNLVTHPLISSLILNEWDKAHKFLMINYIFGVIFTICISLYIYTLYIVEASERYSVSSDSKFFRQHVQDASWWIICFILTYLILRDGMQLIVSPINYFKSFSNYCEISMIVLSMLLLSDIPYTTHGSQRDTICIFTIILSYFGVLFFTNHNVQSHLYVTIFQKVSINYAKIMIWYLTMTIGFSLIFFIIFGTKSEDDDDKSSNFFRSWELSIFHTILMNLGNISLGDVPLDKRYSVVAHIVFLLFVFLMVVILMNILNGFAITDTQAIMKEAEYHVRIQQVESLYNFQTFAIRANAFLQNYFPKGRKLLNNTTKTAMKPVIKLQLELLPAEARKVYYDRIIAEEQEKLTDNKKNVKLYGRGKDNRLQARCRTILHEKNTQPPAFRQAKEISIDEVKLKVGMMLKELEDLKKFLDDV